MKGTQQGCRRHDKTTMLKAHGLSRLVSVLFAWLKLISSPVFFEVALSMPILYLRPGSTMLKSRDVLCCVVVVCCHDSTHSTEYYCQRHSQSQQDSEPVNSKVTFFAPLFWAGVFLVWTQLEKKEREEEKERRKKEKKKGRRKKGKKIIVLVPILSRAVAA